jgi:hypothetical protein
MILINYLKQKQNISNIFVVRTLKILLIMRICCYDFVSTDSKTLVLC